MSLASQHGTFVWLVGSQSYVRYPDKEAGCLRLQVLGPEHASPESPE